MSIHITQIGIQQKMHWTNAIALGVFHLGAVAALFNFNWHALWLMLILYWMCTGLGISMGYHRLHTHRSYRVPVALEYIFAVLGTLTLEGGPIFWVATHRIHHQHSDQTGDPHSPRRGGWWAHIGWLLVREGEDQQKVFRTKYAPDLAQNQFYVWLDSYHWVPLILLGILLFELGGTSFVLWGIFLRVVIGLHSTWLVNSAAHLWGSRRFDTRDDSRNNWMVALISSGEGWHNNHHAHPTSARHGLAWYEFDQSWIQIRVLQFFGLATCIRTPAISSIRLVRPTLDQRRKQCDPCAHNTPAE